MNKLRLPLNLLPLLLLPLVLSACGTGATPTTPPKNPPPTPQETAERTFRYVCAAVPIADLAFQAVAAFSTNVIDANAVKWEGIVVTNLSARCTGPAPDVTTIDAVAAEIEHDVAQVMSVVAAAKANAPPKVP